MIWFKSPNDEETFISLEFYETYPFHYKVPAKLKVGGSTNNSTAGSRAGSVAGSRRSSPRKNIGKKTWHSPRKSAGSALARQNKLPLRGALQGGGARQNIRVQPDVGVKSAAEMRKKKLRVAVMTALLEKGIKENNPIFRWVLSLCL